MTELSIPQQLTTVGDATLAPYDADEWAKLHTGASLGRGLQANSGAIYGNDGGGVNYGLEVNQTTIASTQVVLRGGTAVVRGTVYYNDADLNFTVAANVSGNPRIDTLVLRKDYVAQTVRAAIKQGSPAATPAPPALTQSEGSTWEIPIANIAVSNGFSVIRETDINPQHQWASVPAMQILDRVLNNSGITLQTGDVVVWDTTADRAVTTTTSSNAPRVAGVWLGYTANGSRGLLIRAGYGFVRFYSGTTGIGTFTMPRFIRLITRNLARYAIPGDNQLAAGFNTPVNLSNMVNLVGYTLQEIVTSAGSIDQLTPALIQIETSGQDIYHLVGTAAGDAGTFTNGAWRTRALNSFTRRYVNVAANQFTLQPGVYMIRGSAPAYRVDGHETRLFNITAGAAVVQGTTEYSPSAADSSQTRSFVETDEPLILTTATVYELQHQCVTTRATDGLGKGSAISANDTFAEVIITRLGDAF